ncbi:MAG: hypothetical protein M1305_07720 [Candidatus Marsarchaeota archaeon]|nr:hypothetical protein [Candidatus Marsarchaeota archaeon]
MRVMGISDAAVQGFRKQVLAQEIARYVRRGYEVLSRGAFSAHLVRKKKFSLSWGVLLLILGVVPGIVYMFWHLASKQRYGYLTVDPVGRVESIHIKR